MKRDYDASWIGSRIRELRLRVGLSEAEAALPAGIAVSTLRKIEKGQAVPRWDTVIALAGVLGVSLEEIARKPEEERKPARLGRPPKKKEAEQ